ncbi:MAG: hypothetical protein ACFFEV_06750, partial [Candidatus Thorarchaeota archaeon]
MSGRRRLIYFDQTQNERGKLESTYSELGKLLRDNDYDVEPYTEFMILAKNLKDADVLVFGCPNSSKIRPPEMTVLKNYVKKGGGLMLLALSGGDRGRRSGDGGLGSVGRTWNEVDGGVVGDRSGVDRAGHGCGTRRRGRG